jgi:hypothetical protein
MEPGYSAGRTGVNFTDVGFAVACVQILMRGYNYFMGCPNAKFKTQKFVEKFGTFPQEYLFIHPKIADPHMLVLLENFNLNHIHEVYQKHKTLLDDMLWVMPDGVLFRNFAEAIESAESNLTQNLQAS